MARERIQMGRSTPGHVRGPFHRLFIGPGGKIHLFPRIDRYRFEIGLLTWRAVFSLGRPSRLSISSNDVVRRSVCRALLASRVDRVHGGRE